MARDLGTVGNPDITTNLGIAKDLCIITDMDTIKNP
jgi:hypothetical protein